MKMLKYSTENLSCYLCKDLLGEEHYQIFENDYRAKPVAIYVDRTTLHLREDFPKPESSYKHFDEMCKIITFLYSIK